MKALAAVQIVKILKSVNCTKKVFKGVCARNVSTRPAKNIKAFQAFVHNKGFLLRGIHWVLILYTERCTYFFDSFGRSPKELFLETSVKSSLNPVLYNIKPLQSARSEVCWHYCIYFLIQLSRNRTLASINKVFGKNLRKNDQLVFNFV